MPDIQLARERTRLARERTILAHIRTGFASLLFGTAVLGLFHNVATEAAGSLFIVVGTLFLLSGWISYFRSNRRTRHLLEEVERPLERI